MALMMNADSDPDSGHGGGVGGICSRRGAMPLTNWMAGSNQQQPWNYV